MLVLGLVLVLLLVLLGPSGASKRLSNTWHFVDDLNHRMHVYLQVDTPLPAHVTFLSLDYEQHVCKQMTLLLMQLWGDPWKDYGITLGSPRFRGQATIGFNGFDGFPPSVK